MKVSIKNIDDLIGKVWSLDELDLSDYRLMDQKDAMDEFGIDDGDNITTDSYYLELYYDGWGNCTTGFYFKVNNDNLFDYILREILEYEDCNDYLDFNGVSFSRFREPDSYDVKNFYNYDNFDNQGCITYKEDGNYRQKYYIMFKTR